MNENDTTYSYLATKASLYMPSHPPLPFTSTELERLGFAYVTGDSVHRRQPEKPPALAVGNR